MMQQQQLLHSSANANVAQKLRLETPLKQRQQQSPQSATTSATKHATPTTEATTTATASNSFDSLQEVAARLFLHRSKDLTKTDALTTREKETSEQCQQLTTAVNQLNALRACHEATVECQMNSLAHRRARLAEVEDLVSGVAEAQQQLHSMGLMSEELFGIAKGVIDGAAQSDAMLNAATRVMRYSGGSGGGGGANNTSNNSTSNGITGGGNNNNSSNRRKDHMLQITAELRARLGVLDKALATLQSYVPTTTIDSVSGEGEEKAEDDAASSPPLPPILSAILQSSDCEAIRSWVGGRVCGANGMSGGNQNQNSNNSVVAAVTLNYPAFIDSNAKAAEAKVVGQLLRLPSSCTDGHSTTTSSNKKTAASHGMETDARGSFITIDSIVANLRTFVEKSKDKNKEQQKRAAAESGAGEDEAKTEAMDHKANADAVDDKCSSSDDDDPFTPFDDLISRIDGAISTLREASGMCRAEEEAATTSTTSLISTAVLDAQKKLLLVNKQRAEAILAALKAEDEAKDHLTAARTNVEVTTATALSPLKDAVSSEEALLAAAKAEEASLKARLAEAEGMLATEEAAMAAALEEEKAMKEGIEALMAAEAKLDEESARIEADTSADSIAAMLEAERAAVEALKQHAAHFGDDVSVLKQSLTAAQANLIALAAHDAMMDKAVLASLVNKVATVTTLETEALTTLLLSAARGGDGSDGKAAATASSTIVPVEILDAIQYRAEDYMTGEEEEEEEDGDGEKEAEADDGKRQDENDNANDEANETNEHTAAATKKKEKASLPRLTPAELTALTGINVDMLTNTTFLHIDGLAAATNAQHVSLAQEELTIRQQCEAARRRFGATYPNYAPTALEAMAKSGVWVEEEKDGGDDAVVLPPASRASQSQGAILVSS